MITQRGPGRGSYIGGKSVHNQRVERLWRDVFYGVTELFYDLFYYLEDIGELDVTDEIHLWALHYVYIPRINNSLKLFANGWNAHPLSSEGNRTPEQLWILGLRNHVHETLTGEEVGD